MTYLFFGRVGAPVRVALAVVALLLGLAAGIKPASAATPAEQFVSENVQHGLSILNDKQLSKDERRAKFRGFLLGLTDIKEIADYTLGQYRRTATPEELSAYESAFKDYALAVYESYFVKYTGQTLNVTGSVETAPGETIVKTVMIDPKAKANAKPLEVDFRVEKSGNRMVVADFSVEGVWVRELERNDFTSILGQNGGNVADLTAKLKSKAQQLH